MLRWDTKELATDSHGNLKFFTLKCSMLSWIYKYPFVKRNSFKREFHCFLLVVPYLIFFPMVSVYIVLKFGWANKEIWINRASIFNVGICTSHHLHTRKTHLYVCWSEMMQWQYTTLFWIFSWSKYHALVYSCFIFVLFYSAFSDGYRVFKFTQGMCKFYCLHQFDFIIDSTREGSSGWTWRRWIWNVIWSYVWASWILMGSFVHKQVSWTGDIDQWTSHAYRWCCVSSGKNRSIWQHSLPLDVQMAWYEVLGCCQWPCRNPASSTSLPSLWRRCWGC